MNKSELELLLKNTKYEPFIGFMNSVKLKSHIYNDLYKIAGKL